MAKRFIAVWVLAAGAYMILAVFGPNGLVPGGRWPLVNQHLLQVRAWRGEDIVTASAEDARPERIPVSPRLDVTPYFRSWVQEDPREHALLANLACMVPGPEGGPAWHAAQSVERLDLDRLVCNVGFPLGPAFLLLPLRVLLGGALATQWLAAVLGGLAVASLDRLLPAWLDSLGLPASPDRVPDRALTLLAGGGTLLAWLVPDGAVFFFSQVVAIAALAGAVLLAWRGRRVLAGVAWGLALTSRPAMVLAAPLLLVLAWRESPSCRSAMRRTAALVVPAMAFVLLQMSLNQARFGSPLEFGYSFMLTPPELRHRLLEHGQLNPVYLPENVYWTLLRPPQVVRDPATGRPRFPFLVSHPRGMGLLFVSPALLAGLLTLRRRWLREPLLQGAWLSLVLSVLPGLLYFNTGWVQWGGRFLMDAWPFWLLVAGVGLRQMTRRSAAALVALSITFTMWAVCLTVARVWPACCM